MSPKDYLSQARTLAGAIERKQEQIERLEAMARRATGSYNAVRVGGTSSRSKLEDAVVRLDELRDDLGEQLTAYEQLEREITAAIEAVENPKYRELLELRYLSKERLTWEQIAERMEMSYVHVVHNLHPAALNMVRVNSI